MKKDEPSKAQEQPVKEAKNEVKVSGSLVPGTEEDDSDVDPEEQAKMILDQFNLIYENDP